MEASLFPLILIAGVTLVVVIGVLAYLAEKKRREMLRGTASGRGWAFQERDDAWVDAFEGAPFGRGHKRRAHNVLTGQHDGRDFVGFDYVYHTTHTSTDSQGRTQTREESHWYSVLALRVGADLPRLEVQPEGFFGRAVGKMTGRDIQLESEEFNRAFTVEADDRKFAYDVLHPRLMEQLLRTRDVGWKLQQGWILTIESGRHDVADIDRRLGVVDTVLDALPGFVREQYGLPAQEGPR